MQPSGTHKEGKKFGNCTTNLLCVGRENEARSPSFWKASRIAEMQVALNWELTSLSEGKIKLENLGMRNPLFVNFDSLI